MEDIFGVDVHERVDDLPCVGADFLLTHLGACLQTPLQILDGQGVTPSEQYSRKMYWLLASSNQ